MISLSHSSPLPACGLLCNGCVVVYFFFIDVLTVSHLHLPAHRRPFRACCPWPTCRLQTACSSRGATANPKTIASRRATRIARKLARSPAGEPAAATTASGPPNGSQRSPGRAAVLRAWTTMMTRITWMHVSRTPIMVRPKSRHSLRNPFSCQFLKHRTVGARQHHASAVGLFLWAAEKDKTINCC